MKKVIDDHAFPIVLGIAVLVFWGFGYRWEHKAFLPVSPPGHAFAAAFVQDPSANLSLSATVYPDSPWRDTLAVRVWGAPAGRDGWLLVIECPPGSADPSRPATLLSESTGATAGPISTVAVYSGAMPSRTVKLGCFTPTGSSALNPSSTPGYASIGSVTLPALETDQAMESSMATPTLYADHTASAGPVQLIQVFHGASCPPSAPAGNPSPSPSAHATAGPVPSPGPGIPGCFVQGQTGGMFSTYYFPSSVRTKETLANVDLTGYQVESIFPAPQIKSDRGIPGQGAAENYIWTGLSGLSPSLIASNLSGQQAVSHDTFLAGVFLGMAGGMVVTLLERIWPRHILPERIRKKNAPAPAAGEPPVGESVPAGADLPSGSR